MTDSPPKAAKLSQEETERLLLAAQQGDREAKEIIFQANMGLIYLVMERFKSTRYEFEDLFQIGAIGLVKAIERFDFDYKVRFSTYAVPMIIGEIRRFLRDDGLLKVQRSLKETYQRVKWAQEKLRAELDREPTIGEISDMLGTDKEDIVLAIEACQAPTSIYDLISNQEKDKLKLIDTIGDVFQKDDFLEKMALKEAMEKLDNREREIVRRRFFNDETQMAIAGDLGISQVQVSRIERYALKRLRGLMSG